MSSATSTNALPKSVHPADKWKPAFYTERKNKTTDGDEIISFAQNYFNVLKGFRSGEPLRFTTWQKWLLRRIYERTADGRLRYRRVYVELPRKNGKSLLGSTIALYSLFAGEPGAEVYSAAGDRQQARIVFETAKQQVLRSSALSGICKMRRLSA